MYRSFYLLLVFFSWSLVGQEPPDGGHGEQSAASDKELCYIRMNRDQRQDVSLDDSSSDTEEDRGPGEGSIGR